MTKRNNGRGLEKRIANRIGGKVTPFSGAGAVKEDVIDPTGWLVQAKQIDKPDAQSYGIKFEDLRNLRFNAAAQGRKPRMEIELPNGDIWVVLPLQIFEHIRNDNASQEDS